MEGGKQVGSDGSGSNSSSSTSFTSELFGSNDLNSSSAIFGAIFAPNSSKVETTRKEHNPKPENPGLSHISMSCCNYMSFEQHLYPLHVVFFQMIARKLKRVRARLVLSRVRFNHVISVHRFITAARTFTPNPSIPITITPELNPRSRRKTAEKMILKVLLEEIGGKVLYITRKCFSSHLFL